MQDDPDNHRRQKQPNNRNASQNPVHLVHPMKICEESMDRSKTAASPIDPPQRHRFAFIGRPSIHLNGRCEKS
jgi:hypothetical protein